MGTTCIVQLWRMETSRPARQFHKQANTNVGVIYNRKGSDAGYQYWTHERGFTLAEIRSWTRGFTLAEIALTRAPCAMPDLTEDFMKIFTEREYSHCHRRGGVCS